MNPENQVVKLASGLAGAGHIDDFELFYARRALRLLKSKLGHQGILDLLADDIEEGNAFLRTCAQESEGQFDGDTIVLTGEGISASEFVRWLGKSFADEKVLLAAHPEHWAFSVSGEGPVNVVETIGSHPSSFYMAGWGAEAPSWAAESEAVRPESEYPIKNAADLVLDDGTVVGRVLCQFGDTATGLSVALTVYVPEACKEIVEEHLMHFSVEFRNWIVAAAAEHGSSEQPES